MSMISFALFGLVTVVFIGLRLVNRLIKDDVKVIKWANYVLVIASYIFVIYADWRFAVILAILTFSTWYCAKKEKMQVYGIVFAILVLAFFKYMNFFVDSFGKIIGMNFDMLNIILPLGISFYSFSAIGYLVDVSRGSSPRNLLDVTLYLSFFPKITSGPIQSSEDFFTQIDKKRMVGWDTFSVGIQIFVFGLFKKIVLADRLSIFVNQVYETPLAFGSFTVFLAAVAYSFQIYFDFSGYSDMAIGVAKILGINLPRNFNMPYLSHNVTELWKRWHITLSKWLQEYLYIALGGNRKGKFRTYINLVLTMVIGGLWHGANWTYIIWGLLHGVALTIHKGWMKVFRSSEKRHSFLGDALSIVITFLFTTFCWIFFRSQSISQAFQIIGRIFSFERGLEQPYFWLAISIVVWIIICILAHTRNSNGENSATVRKTNVCKIEGYYPIVDLTSFWGLVAFFTFCGMMLCLAYTGGSPFIYGNY